PADCSPAGCRCATTSNPEPGCTWRPPARRRRFSYLASKSKPMMTKSRSSALRHGTRALATACTALLIVGSAHAQSLEVTTSFSILSDLVSQDGGERVKVRTLVGADEDAHAFQPRPSDARNVGGAALVVVNGLGFDDWMVRLARSGGYKGEVVVASAGIDTLAMTADEHEHEHGHDRGDEDEKAKDKANAKAVDPHAWQDVGNVRRYVANIADALTKADPEGATAYRA